MAARMWRHIPGRTWCIDGHITIPVYLLNERKAVLLDSGYADRDRPILEALLRQKGLRVRAILGTHSHNDHNENHAYFQKAHGAEIVLRGIEAAVISAFLAHSGVYKSIQALITKNILDRERRTAEILEWLQERDCWTRSEVEQLLWEKLQGRNTSFMGQIIFQSNATCVMEYLVNTDSVSKELRAGTAYYTVIHKKAFCSRKQKP